LGEAAGLRIRASEKRLAVAATITEGFRRNGNEKVHVRYGNAPYVVRSCVVGTGRNVAHSDKTSHVSRPLDPAQYGPRIIQRLSKLASC
jgi:hypothetical protein